jgi:hypothetical protein
MHYQKGVRPSDDFTGAVGTFEAGTKDVIYEHESRRLLRIVL